MKKSNTPKDFPIFSKLDKRQITLFKSKIKFYLKNFENYYGLFDIKSNGSVLGEICERIEKRRIYFHIFYDGCEMGELNEGALMCFWIIKLMPFSHEKMHANELNAKIALYLLYRVLLYHAKKHSKAVNVSEALFNDIYYAFRYRDISKEAMMVLAESLIIGYQKT